MYKYYTEETLSLPENTIFVFGSNCRGAHGAGSALTALKRFGAIYGIGEGLQGISYAIPTKDMRIRTLPLDKIKEYVDHFVEHTHRTKYQYYVTAVGTGLAGYQHSDMAPMFKNAKNCIFPIQWKHFLED